MTLEPLPDNLLELERRLAGREFARPSASLRTRVLVAAEREIERAESPKAARWRLAGACAAAMVIGGNLALTASSATRFCDEPRPTADEVARLSQSMRQIAPELSPAQAQQLALMEEAGRRLPRLPLVSGPAMKIDLGGLP